MMDGNNFHGRNRLVSREASGKVNSRANSLRSQSSSNANKRKSTSLPNETVEYLKAWMMSPDHIVHPYPTEAEKVQIMTDTGIEIKQLTNWFVNNRKRFWKPRIEAHIHGEKITKPADHHEIAEVDHCSAGEIRLNENNASSVEVTPKRLGSVSPDSSTSSSPSKTLFALQRNRPNLVSTQTSVVSLSDMASSDDETELPVGEKMSSPHQALKTESVDVHILRPMNGSSQPRLVDVSVLSKVPAEQILRTYENCTIKYWGSSVTGSNETSSHRDVEISRIKKRYLALYLSELINTATTSNDNANINKRLHVVTPEDVENNNFEPRPKYRRHSVELWKAACQTANHVYDQELPSLEEAAQLFGYQ